MECRGQDHGDLNLNGEFPLTSNGVYIGDQTTRTLPVNMAILKEGTVERVTFSIGSLTLVTAGH